MSAVSDEIQ